MADPKIGSPMQIKSYKHNGQLHRTWQETTILKATSTRIIGANDRTRVLESDGRSWLTREPAICFFYTEHWFNVISMLRADGIHYYCNISSPFVFEDGAVKYIDYDLDVKVFPDMTYTLLDEDEYELHSQQMNYPQEIDRVLWDSVEELTHMIRQRKGPFSHEKVEQLYELFLTYPI
ncbi:hypothetical protein SAMN05421734_1048 [Pelagirhabdus alkalitolerans]|uniref:DUF402 domain-containing protein n=1 Tax=Pelagirhabdus alkalitolerans TaxID=1612202 RepID=A0A1G6IET3_9BACI|nr:DUF402 domain-containing protein [Pelagirhabdus alkalitolerans]SDC04920.1 hypothetical protein SAMN05421734_1048 [Pelagirhabdus alkalitolerans]